MAETVAVHHPQHPGSDMVSTRKAFDVDLSREGYVLGHSNGSMPLTAPTPPAQDGGQRVTLDPTEVEAMRLRLQGVEERETALALREVELDRRELVMRDREAGPQTAEQDGDPVPPGLSPPGSVLAPFPPAADVARKAARAQAERDRRARLRDAQRGGQLAAETIEQEGTP